MRRGLSLLALGLAAMAGSACRAAPARPDVVLVVLDTVRRDRVQPCGYGRPTTPTLLELSRQGTTWCGMVTPGTWTLPVHASIFTGRLPFEHGADFAAPESGLSYMALKVDRMRGDLETLADRFAREGYRTALASSNPALDPALGVARGFEVVRVNRAIDAAARPGIVKQLLEPVTGTPDRRRPLFLVLNLSAAHSPYEGVPAGAGWLEPTPTVSLYDAPGGDRRNGLFGRFVRGEMPADERERTLGWIRAAYDWGVRLADEQLGEALRLLRADGRTGDDDVLVVTSDHGEMLGEEGLLDHGRTVAAANLDVFAVVKAPGFAPGGRDGSLVQSQDLFPTLLAAAGLAAPALPDAWPLRSRQDSRKAFTFNWPDANWIELTDGRAGADAIVAVQRGGRRAVFRDPGGRLATEERVADEWRAGEADPGLADLARRIAPVLHRRKGEAVVGDAELRESLRALGYVQ